jgi:cell division protein FtsL
MWWDLIQQGQLSDLGDQIEAQQKEIDELKANVERLAKWVMFLATDGKDIDVSSNNNDASDSEALRD